MPGARRWRLTDAEGATYEADVLVCAIGTFTTPSVPDIEGLDVLRRALLPLGALGARARPGGPPGGRHRDGSQRGADRPRAGQGGAGRSTSSSARPQWILPRSDKPFTEEQKRRFARNPLAARRHRREIYWAFENNIAFRTARRAPSSSRRSRAATSTYRIEDDELRAKLTPD